MRAAVITLVMATILGASQSRHVCVRALSRSAQTFQQYFEALRQEPLNPVQRLVFSLALMNAEARDSRAPRHG